MSKPLIPAKNSPEADLVMTPRDLAKAIIEHLPLSGTVLDPCRGDGAFFDQLPASVRGEWAEVKDGRDFFEWTQHVNWIVSNPPWSKYRKFAQHAYEVADNVAFLVTINHDLALKARLRDMNEAGFGIREVVLTQTPGKETGWPQSGFQLGVVWKQRGFTGTTVFSNLP